MDEMGKIRTAFFRLLLLAGALVTGAQAVVMAKGSSFCLGESCRVVEGYLSVDPLVMSLAGLAFFILLLALSLFSGRAWSRYAMVILLLSAMVAEGILFGIQLFVAGRFCSYCLCVMALVLGAALIFSLRWFLAGCLFMAVQLFFFSNLDTGIRDLSSVSLAQGTYGVKSCSSPSRLAYLIFSDTCPHCRRVLDELKGCTACEIRFNPVKEIESSLLPGIARIEGYDPRINRLFLRLIGISAIPVLVEQTDQGLTIIKGERAIMEFLRDKCFCSGTPHEILPSDFGAEFGLDGSDTCSQQEACGQ